MDRTFRRSVAGLGRTCSGPETRSEPLVKNWGFLSRGSAPLPAAALRIGSATWRLLCSGWLVLAASPAEDFSSSQKKPSGDYGADDNPPITKHPQTAT